MSSRIVFLFSLNFYSSLKEAQLPAVFLCVFVCVLFGLSSGLNSSQLHLTGGLFPERHTGKISCNMVVFGLGACCGWMQEMQRNDIIRNTHRHTYTLTHTLFYFPVQGLSIHFINKL